MQYPPNVERWRGLVQKYFPPELVDKALWVIQHESGGNPSAVGDGGVARGLFQIQDNRSFSSRPDAAYLDNPENNIKYAAQQLGAASGRWSDWGEGSLYQGKKFGALGNHPYPGSSGATEYNPGDTTGDVRRAVVPRLGWDPATDTFTGGTDMAAGGKKNSLFDTITGTITGKDNSGRTYGTALEAPDDIPSGDFNTQAIGWANIARKAWMDLAQYKQSKDVVVDEEGGVVYDRTKTDGFNADGSPAFAIDVEATRILQKALDAELQFSLLYEMKQAGLVDNGESAAQAFLNSEKEKSADAADAYDDYVKRIGDVVALEDIPKQRAASVAGLLSTINEATAKSGRTYGPRYGTSGQPKGTDVSQFASAIKGTIPSEAPAPYRINPAALAPAPSASGSVDLGSSGSTYGVPLPSPDDILGGFSQAPSSSGGPIVADWANGGSNSASGSTANTPFTLPNPLAGVDPVALENAIKNISPYGRLIGNR